MSARRARRSARSRRPRGARPPDRTRRRDGARRTRYEPPAARTAERTSWRPLFNHSSTGRCRAALPRGRLGGQFTRRSPCGSPHVPHPTHDVHCPFTDSRASRHLASLASVPARQWRCADAPARDQQSTGTTNCSGEGIPVKLHTPARIAAVAVLGTLALAACGSDNNNSGSSSSAGGAAPAYCASGTLNASGSTAQANAMTEWIKDYQTACSGATINYSGGGSGQGVTDFTSGQSTSPARTSAAHRRPRVSRTRPTPGARRQRRRPADGARPDRRRLQPPGRQQPEPVAGNAGQDLQRQDHQVE